MYNYEYMAWIKLLPTGDIGIILYTKYAVTGYLTNDNMLHAMA